MSDIQHATPVAVEHGAEAGPQHESQREPRRERQRAALPAVDVFEDAGGITLLADLPGVPKDQLDLKIEGDALSIEGRVQATTPEGLEPLYAELRVPLYRRSFTLSRELDTSRVEASLKDGVLTLRIPRQAHAQARRIEVAAG